MSAPSAATATPPATSRDDDVLLDVRDLRTYFHVMDGTVRAVDGVDFRIKRGGRLALVGESGCGKSVTALTIMRLIDQPPGEIVSGEVWFDGRDLLKLSDREMHEVRGGEIAMIFQEPMSSLNPVLTVGDQITEAVKLHQQVTDREALEVATQALRDVGVPAPERRVKQYPHELSGGMRQRIMIAMALSCRPQLIIADEATTALDVTIQRQILELIKAVQERTGTSLLLITHDLGVVAETVDEVVVMYAGRIMETGTVEEVLLDPRHPYSRGLLQSIPSRGKRGQPLHVIRGVVPNPFRMPVGCKFEPRCPYAWEQTKMEEPQLYDLGGGRASRCWLYDPRYRDRLRRYDEEGVELGPPEAATELTA